MIVKNALKRSPDNHDLPVMSNCSAEDGVAVFHFEQMEPLANAVPQLFSNFAATVVMAAE